MTELTTDRLVLRRFSTDDAGFVFDLYSRWEVQRFIGPHPRVMTDPAEADRRTARCVAFDHPIHGIWLITVKSGHTPVGVLLLKPLPASGPDTPLHDSDDIEIGWHLHPDAWGHGYATEAAQAVLAHAFTKGVEEVFAVTSAGNTASEAVTRRIGMTPHGTTSAYYNAQCQLYSIQRPTPPVE